jgi:DNA-3-methyladenine glycosylase
LVTFRKNVLKKHQRLKRGFFRRDPQTVARELLGQRLVRQVAGERIAGLIVETEAYMGVKDKAAHSFGGRRTSRTETMFADGGTAYVYLNYGLHHLFNVVTDSIDVPTAVLIRAIEPT